MKKKQNIVSKGDKLQLILLSIVFGYLIFMNIAANLATIDCDCNNYLAWNSPAPEDAGSGSPSKTDKKTASIPF